MLADLRELARSILDALPHAALVVSDSGQTVMRNAAAGDMLPSGAMIDEILAAAGIAEIHWATEMAALAEGRGRLVRRNVRLTARGNRQLVADVHLRRLGPCRLIGAPAPGGSAEADAATGQVADGSCVLVLVDDISARVSIERRLAAGERLAAAGTLAAKVAHELNNPLDGVLRFVGLAERVAGPEASEYLTQARGGLMRMAEIVRGLLERGRPWQASGERAEVQALLDEAVRTMQPRAHAIGVSVVCDFDDRVDGAVEGSVFQVFCNIIKNALDAMPDGGVLAIAVCPADRQCEIVFEDTGSGLTEEEADRIFEPFYTTKPPGEGSGLGLAICREILARLGGTISAGARTEGGASITVRLPLHPAWRPVQQESAT